MDRGIERPEQEINEPLARETRSELPEGVLHRERHQHEIRGYRYQLSETEMSTLQQIGCFRTVAVDDLVRFEYRGQASSLKEDLKSLQAQGLVQCRNVAKTPKEAQLIIVVLTKHAKEVLERRESKPSNQRLYAGFVKPAEVRHDAAIYRMFHAEAERLKRAGARISRVVLDYELKQKIYRPLAKARSLPPLEFARRQAEIASETGLKVIHGKILLPDLRIEYQKTNGEQTFVDLELATDHYRGSQMRAKAEAGFKMYAAQENIARLTSAFDPERVSQIFSF